MSGHARRFDFIDAIRGSAALAVMVEHFTIAMHPGFRLWSMRWFDLGRFGVVAFFLVSGFVIPTSLQRSSLREFWINRAFRLYPAYWLSVVLAVCTVPDWMKASTPAPASPVAASLVNLTMLQEFVHVPHANGVYWTLSIELVFYVLCSILFATRLLGRPLLLAGAACAVLAASSSVTFAAQLKGMPLIRIALLATSVVGIAWRARFDRTMPTAPWRWIVVCFSIVIAGTLAAKSVIPGAAEIDGALPGLLATWAGGGLLVAMLFALRDRRMPRPLVLLGKISYSLYLLHGFIAAVTPRSLSPIVWLVVASSGTLVVSSLSYRLLECPLIELGRSLARRRATSVDAEPVVPPTVS